MGAYVMESKTGPGLGSWVMIGRYGPRCTLVSPPAAGGAPEWARGAGHRPPSASARYALAPSCGVFMVRSGGGALFTQKSGCGKF
ncbi:hypothetical protein EVAR_85076_1 [Eumeta japonica]|uniref:Uncharacterized protein n=1 Tax=Eumeta variegata TaxID=151549 RepID=A0A4C1XF44_EUMVA|nr:hypothetical protein EVAR_85076_1 [Eumeta japonica]